MKAIINARIFDYETYIENGYVVFDHEIVKCGNMDEFKDDGYEIIDAHHNLLMPSFVCAHAHIYSIFARGMILPFDPHCFQDILDQMWWKMDAKLDNKMTYYSGLCAGSEFIKNGITTIIDHHASGTEILGSLSSLNKALVDDMNLRAILAFEISDRFPVKDCIKENVDYYENHHDHHSAGLIGGHAQYTLSDETLDAIHTYANNMPIHLHVAEAQDDTDACLKQHGCGIIQRLINHDVLPDYSLLVHGVHLLDEDIKNLENKNIYFVCNTTSNMNNAVGLPDVMNYVNHGLKVMIGNDGLSTTMANEYLNVFYTARLKNKDPNSINLGHIITFINNAYEYVGHRLDIKIGRIKPGYVADMMLVEYQPFTPVDASNIFGHIFYGLFPAFKPKDVYCDGKQLLKDYQLTNQNINEVLLESQEISKKLWNVLKEEK